MKSTLTGLVVVGALVMAAEVHADGKSIYEQACALCHRAGILNAPVAGNRAAWQPLVKTGKDKLYESAINGKNHMPPKGGKERLSEEEVKSAVDYMVGLAS